RNAQDLPGDARLGQRRQPVGLAKHVQLFADRGNGAAQRAADPFRRAGEIGFAVERSENGAAHQSSAAQAGQYSAAKPLDRDAPAIGQAASAAVDRKRRLIAEIDCLGGEATMMFSATQSRLVQARSPDHVPTKVSLQPNSPSAEVPLERKSPFIAVAPTWRSP